jgi:DNA-binding Lrp family transcriptional regulator
MIDDDRPWTKQEDALLGTDTDRAIAARLGRSTGAVIYRRKRLNIEGFRTRAKRDDEQPVK